jgi:hypothetical protein
MTSVAASWKQQSLDSPVFPAVQMVALVSDLFLASPHIDWHLDNSAALAQKAPESLD